MNVLGTYIFMNSVKKFFPRFQKFAIFFIIIHYLCDCLDHLLGCLYSYSGCSYHLFSTLDIILIFVYVQMF